MYKMIKLLIGLITIFPGVYLIGIQVSYILQEKVIDYTLDFKYLFVNGSNMYFYFLTLIALYFWLDLVYLLFFNKKAREKRKEARRLTKEEKIQFNHLAKGVEAKKGLQRISFDSEGRKNNVEYYPFFIKGLVRLFLIVPPALLVVEHFYFLFASIKGRALEYDLLIVKYSIAVLAIGWIFTFVLSIHKDEDSKYRFHLADMFDYTFDFEKRFYNGIIFSLNNNRFFKCNISDVHKLNTLKKHTIGNETTTRRGGIPIETYKTKMYVDATDSHSFIIGTTNSGKTYGLIHPMIENLRMAGENMLINDLKGELFRIHSKQLIKSGYDVKVINFVEPHKSIQWNPLGLVIKKYREAQQNTNREIEKNEEFKKIEGMLQEKKEYLIDLDMELEDISNRKFPGKELQQKLNEKEELRKEIELLKKRLPQADFSEAFELLKDIALTLCYDANAKDPFWNSQAGILLEGLVAFLLEETTRDEFGNRVPLPDEMINLKSVKILLNQGMTNIGGGQPGKERFLLKSYLDKYREPTDYSVMKLSEYLGTAQNVRGSITSVFADKIDIAILNDNIVKMTSRNEFNFADFNNKKLAVFLIVHDEKKTYYPLVTIFVKQFYEELIKLARGEKNLRLNYPCNIIYDEFGISPALKDVDSILAAGRSRGVRMNMVIQDTAQVDKNYGKEVAKSIKNNVMNTVYLLGSDPDTLEEISKRSGNKLVWNRESGKFDTTRVVSTERLGKFDLGEALILRQRKNPSITRYYPYHKFLFYKNNEMDAKAELRDFPETVWFDINKALNARRHNNQKKLDNTVIEVLNEKIVMEDGSEKNESDFIHDKETREGMKYMKKSTLKSSRPQLKKGLES